ncbi:MAG TPA: hypothetical protein VHD87_00875 [Acidimicrobiales bacterium]|nr:hypothetical protein [Acidimicrobiales bacterium]
MKRLAAAALLVGLAACGHEEPKLADPVTTVPQSVNAPTTSSTPPTTLIESDASTPAAGTCGNAPEGGAAVITLNPDVPSPRCVIVHSENQLTFVNNTDTAQTVDVGYDQATLQPHATHAFPQPVGDYWARGVHRVNMSLYNGSGPEVWLQG